MALGLLVILYLIIFILAIVFQILLYAKKSNNIIIIINMLFSLLLVYLAFSTYPTNFVVQKTIAIVMGVIAIIAVILKFSNDKFLMLSKGMLTISMLICIALLLL